MDASPEEVVDFTSAAKLDELMVNNAVDVNSPAMYRWVVWWKWWSKSPPSGDSDTRSITSSFCKSNDWPEYPDQCQYPNWVLGLCINPSLRINLLVLLKALSTDGSVSAWSMQQWRTIIPNAGVEQVRSILSWRVKNVGYLQLLRKQLVNGLDIEQILNAHLKQQYPNLARRLQLEFGLGESQSRDKSNTPEFVDGFFEVVEDLAITAGFEIFSKTVSDHDFDCLVKSFSDELMGIEYPSNAGQESEAEE